jgi:imidazolonepropionase-like amidohydrolase
MRILARTTARSLPTPLGKPVVATFVGCLLLADGAVAQISPAMPGQGPDVTAWVGATLVDPTRPQPEAPGTLIVESGRITAVLDPGAPVPDGAEVRRLDGLFVIPGLIDAHTHIESVDAARRALASGVTTVRSLGSLRYADVGARELARTGIVGLPEVVAGGWHVRRWPLDPFYLDHPELADLMDTGVADTAAVRSVARAILDRGVQVLKVNATERAGLPNTDPRKQLFDEAALTVLVEEGRRRGVPVAAHAHGDEGGRDAVLAGAISIEHGTYLSDETLALMAERGTWLVPTIAVVVDLTQPGGDYDSPTLRLRGGHMLPRVRDTARRARALGVSIAAGTDTRYGPDSEIRLSQELVELVGIGMSPAEALAAGTSEAARLLGVEQRVGALRPGGEADFVALERHPFEDLGALDDALLVVSDGRVVVDRR